MYTLSLLKTAPPLLQICKEVLFHLCSLILRVITTAPNLVACPFLVSKNWTFSSINYQVPPSPPRIVDGRESEALADLLYKWTNCDSTNETNQYMATLMDWILLIRCTQGGRGWVFQGPKYIMDRYIMDRFHLACWKQSRRLANRLEILQEELQNAGGYVSVKMHPCSFTHLECVPSCLPSVVSYMCAGHDLRKLRKERDSFKFSQMSPHHPTHTSIQIFILFLKHHVFVFTNKISSPKGHPRESVKDVGVSAVSDLIILLTLWPPCFQQS